MAATFTEGRPFLGLDHSGAASDQDGECAPGRNSSATNLIIDMSTQPKSDDLRGVFHGCRRYFVNALIFSFAINMLYLAAPLYMLQVYDRVISSSSHVTLVMLTIVLLFALVTLAGLDFVRARVLTRASVRLDRRIAGRVLAAT